jgi:hypothetical protein
MGTVHKLHTTSLRNGNILQAESLEQASCYHSRCWSANRVPLRGITPLICTVQAQEPLPTQPPQPEILPPTEGAPPGDNAQSLPQWTHQHQQQNQQGTVTNTHRYLDVPEEGRYVREHIVSNPRGEMTQSWERANSDAGYQYRRSQTWTGPDGMPLRQHEGTIGMGEWLIRTSWDGRFGQSSCDTTCNKKSEPESCHCVSS